MDKFSIVSEKTKSINRSIRLSYGLNEKLNAISLATGVSVNKIVSKCIVFALGHLKK